MRTREEQINPWGYISPFAKKSLQDRAMCDMTITRKSTVSTTMALYTEEHILEAERRAEHRVRAEIGHDSDRLDWLCRNIKGDEARRIVGVISNTGCVDLWREAIDAARENAND